MPVNLAISLKDIWGLFSLISIIFFSKGDQIEDLNKIILDCLYIVKKSIESQIPIKGALSFGNIT